MEKHGMAFWRCWRSKFEQNKRQISQGDTGIIAEHFSSHFGRLCTNSSELESALQFLYKSNEQQPL